MGVAGDALLLGQMATAPTPEATHEVLVGAAMSLLRPEVALLALKHIGGYDMDKQGIPFPSLPWTAAARERAQFEAAAKRHGQTLGP